MMTLREYTSGLPLGGMAQFAKEVGVTPIYLSQLAARQTYGDGKSTREPSPALCVLIEEKTNGVVHRWDMRPDDWHLIWPELRDAPGHPPIAAAQAA